jgi:predicted dehydrogenase
VIEKEDRLLRVGVLGCGPIAQFAHFDACRKARNTELYAICDVAEDLTARIAAIHEPRTVYHDYDAMLADPQVEAILIATADQYHVSLCRRAIAAGKHVLVEKPLGVTIEECEELATTVHATDRIFQVGNNRRFDPGLAFARDFMRDEMGELMALKAWYNDSVHRYTMTDNLQPIPITSSTMRRPGGNPKADKRRYFMLTHGSHMVDMARLLGGDIAGRAGEACREIRRLLLVRFGRFRQWRRRSPGSDRDSARGFRRGFRAYGEHGSVNGRIHLPWFHKSSEVECFSIKDDLYRRPLGQDAFTYKLQLEGFADTILHGKPQLGASVEDGVAAMRAMVALSRSAENGRQVELSEVVGGV